MINVGVSAYSQLQKLKGQEIDATDSDKAKNNVCTHPIQLFHTYIYRVAVVF